MDLQKILNQTISLAKEVGQFIKHEGEHFDTSKIEYKEFNNLVSYVDKQAEERLVAGLREILPEAGFIVEEGTATETKEYNWVVDPLDGTTNFSHGLPVFSVSIGLVKGEEHLVGVVYEINKDECFSATKGGGAFLNGKKISVAGAQKLDECLIATGFPYYMFDKLDIYFDMMKDFIQHTQGLRRFGSAAVDLCYVACGRFDGYFEFNLNPYDVAGGILVVQEAGGVVKDFRGGNDIFDGAETVAANPAIMGQMIVTIGKYWE